MAVKVKWTGNAANLPKERKNDTTPTVRYVGMGSGGNTYQPYTKSENNAARTVTVEDTAPEAQSGGKGFFKRAGLTVSGGAKGSLAGNMDAMGVAYEAGQGGRTQRYTDELREAQWAVARAKHDYDADPGNQLGKNALDTAITKMKAFADTLGKGAYEQALTAAYDVAAKLDTGDLKALYNGLGVVTPEKGTGTQQKAASAARDLAYEVQKSASEDLQRAKEGASKFGQMLVDAGASMTQMGLDTAANALMGTQGTMIPFATRAFGGSTMDARQDGADLKGQALYGGAQAAKEVFTEKMFNIALPFAKAYGKGGLDKVVENGIHMAAEKLGKSDVGRAALEKVLKFGASAVSEGLEEFVGDFMEWQMPRIYGGDTDSLAETFSNALYDFAVGTISGAAGGAVGNVMDAYNDSVQARETRKAYAGREQELLDESKELNPDNDLAKKYQERLDNGKKLSGRQLMRLIEQNETDAVTSDKAKIQSAAEGRLTQLGETGDTAQIAQAITKQVAGEQLSTAEQSLIDGSRYGRRVANEIDPDNVKAVATKDGIVPRDTFASEWTGKLDTKRIYPEVFNRLMPQAQKTGETTARQEGEVTGAKYNAETGKLDAIVTNEAGEVKTVPAAEAEMTPMQEELFDWANELKLEAAGPLMVRAYQPEQNMELYTRSFKLAYEYGKAGMPMDYVEKSEGVNYLHPTQIKLAYEEGQAATQRKVQAREEKIRSGGTADTTARKKGSVSLQGAKVGGKTYAPVNRKTVDSRQWASVKAMRAFSRAVGVDVVFYQSQANERGVYEGANGFYKGGKLYLDINAGRDTVGMTETAILKTAAHELTHFIQANSAQYEALKSFVVNKLTHEEVVSFEDLVADKQRREPGLEYDEAVDEVVADACEMMLKDSTAVEQLAKENRSLAEKIRDWLREWVENLKIALEGLQADRTESRAMMQYAQELQEIWDNALMDAARNNRGAAREAAPAESRQQARIGTSESIKPGEKPLKGMRDDDKMGAVNASLKEDLENGKARKEDRGAFLRRAVEEGYQVFEGKSAAYGYRSVRWEYARENARQIQKELTELGIDAEIVDGDILWNLDGISSARRVPQATAVEKERILINTAASLAPRNIAGHEAFHLWYGLSARRAFEDVVTDNLNFSSKEFIGYQSAISEAYLGDEADLSDETQYTKLMEEIIAYISGDIHEGVNDDLLRPMFRDYDAVKAAWVKLCKDRTGGEVRFSVRESFSKEIDSWAKDGMPEGVRFTLGSTGPVLQGLGAIESDIYMEGDKIQKILQDHPEMTLAEIKKVPQILEDPAMVLKSKTRTNSLVVLGTYRAQNGRPILAAMDLLPRGKGFVVDGMQKVTSAYTKTESQTATAEQVGRKFLMGSDVLFADKKRTAAVLRPMGILAPIDLLRNGYIGSISYKKGFVNIQGVPFSSVVKIETDNRAQNQQRDPRLSDRDVLRMAADMAQRDRSQRWSVEDLNRFDVLRRKLVQLDEANAELEALQEERETLLAGRKVKELTKDERFELAQNRNRTETQKGRIQRLEAEAYKLESVPQVKALLKKSRSIVEREADSRARTEFREAREKQEMLDVTRRKVERNAKRLLEYMNTNTDKKHIPEALKKPIGELLESLNFYSNSARKGGRKTRADQRYCEAMQGLQNALAAQKLFDDTGEGTDLFQGYLDLPAGFESMLGVHVDRVKLAMEKHPLKTDIVREMDLNDLKELDVILSVMSRSVTKMNEMFVNRRFAYVADAAEDSIEAMDRLGQHQDKAKGVEQFALWDNTLPWYAFQRFGEGGKAVFEGLQDGWDKLAFNMKIILDFRRNLIKDVVARKWDTETHKVELTDPDGATVTATLTTAQLMSLYCLSKRKQALGHLLGGGIRPAAIELTDTLGDRIRKRSLTQDKQYKLTEESLGQLLKLLTPEQKKIADAMQKFMTEQGSAWGNAVTMARFGYRGFTEQNYFPIETDAQDRQAKTGDTKEGSLYRLQNISAVKPLVKNANNALILRGIFDVFANHTADMAKYNAMVLPIIDAQKWYNYKYASKNEAGQVSTRTVQRAMTKAYGKSANDFVVTFLRDLNGVKESSDRGTSKAERATSFYKRTAVGMNFRVAVLQITAYVRASFVLDYKYMGKAFAAQERDTMKDKLILEQDRKELLEYSGIALWKEMGFFDTDIGHSLREQIKGKSGKLENLVDKTMIPAEWGDKLTWARLWRACKLEVQDKQHLTGEELLEETARRFREVVYQTQVVDSTMTRSHNMRAGSEWAKAVTAFMSEPTVSYNMVMESTRKTAEDAKRLGMRVAVKRNGKKLVRAYQAYILTEVASAIIESIADAFRDPDDDPFFQKFWTAFWGEKPESFRDAVLGIVLGTNGNLAGNLNPLGKIPLLKDALSALSGEDVSRMDMEALTNTYKALAIWDETIRLENGSLDKATKTTYYGNMTTYGKLYQTSKALSQLSGLPVSSTMREAVTAWNNTVGAAWPNLKRRTYENKQLREAWEKYGKASGVSYAVMYRATQDTKDFESDKDADGNTISGSLKAKYVEYIRSLGLPRAQEKAVWEAAKVSSWSDKDTPWG